jgi:hypothetical protein
MPHTRSRYWDGRAEAVRQREEIARLEREGMSLREALTILDAALDYLDRGLPINVTKINPDRYRIARETLRRRISEHLPPSDHTAR